jgi:hypothetical protein
VTDRALPHLGLKGWPFNRAGPESAEVFIGRDDLRRRLRLLLKSASRVPASQLVLLWADLGAGKTHTLRHLERMAEDERDIVTIFVTTPEGITSFFDVYRACVDGAISAGALASAGRDLFDATKGRVSSDVERAIIRIGMYRDEEVRTAQSWLRGEAVQRQAAKELDVTSRIKTPAEAIDALNDLIHILRRGDRTVLLLIDEVQELADLPPRKQAEAIGGLHKVFDRNPNGLAMVLSFTAASQGTMVDIIGGPLADRANDRLALPAITPTEAKELIMGLLGHWSDNPDLAPAPFDDAAVPAVIERLAGQLPALTPRDVITAFDGILRNADLDIEEHKITTIDVQYALDHVTLPDAGTTGP